MTTNTTKAILVLFFAALSFQSAQAANGLLLYTAGGSPYVNAVQYETFSSPSSHLSYVTVKGGQRMQVKSDGIIANIPYPSSGAQVDQEEASGVIDQTEMFAGRYPQYATLLQSIGELWKRKLEVSKVSTTQPLAPPVASSSPSAIGKKLVSDGARSEIPVLRTKSGKTLKNVIITRFEEGKAVMIYSEGMCRVPLSDLGDLTGLPPDVKLAIEKANAAVDAQKIAEAERIAKEEQEKNRLEQIDQEKKRIVKEAEEQRLAKLKQEQLERSEQNKKTAEVMANLATAEQERLADEKRQQDSKNTPVESSRNNCDKVAEDKIDAYMASIDRKYGKDVEAGFAQMDKDAEGGNVEALFLMGSSYSDNAQDEEKYPKDMRPQAMNVAVDMLKKAADHGHTPSQYRLANIYLLRPFDWGIPYDKAEGVKWLQKAGAQGSERAQQELREIEQNANSVSGKNKTNTADQQEKSEHVVAAKDSVPNNYTQTTSSTPVNKARYPDFKMNRRGPVIHGFQLGMSREEFDSNLKIICPHTGFVRKGSPLNIGGLVGVSRGYVFWDLFASPERNWGGGLYSLDASVVSIGSPPVVVAFTLCRPALEKIFNIPDKNTAFRDLCQSITDNYNIPRLSGTNLKVSYKSNDGWFLGVTSSRSADLLHVELAAIPEKSDYDSEE
ncbi:MAG: hypothetical protein WCI20_07020 [bacterium]